MMDAAELLISARSWLSLAARAFSRGLARPLLGLLEVSLLARRHVDPGHGVPDVHVGDGWRVADAAGGGREQDRRKECSHRHVSMSLTRRKPMLLLR